MLSFIVLVATLVVNIGILTAAKRGFNEVIRGLESVDGKINRPPPTA